MINKIYYLEAASQNPVGCQYSTKYFSISYDSPYQPPPFGFFYNEWTSTGWKSSKDKPLRFQHGNPHNNRPGSRWYTPGKNKNYIGRWLGFRCMKKAS